MLWDGGESDGLRLEAGGREAEVRVDVPLSLSQPPSPTWGTMAVSFLVVSSSGVANAFCEASSSLTMASDPYWFRYLLVGVNETRY